MKMYEEPRFEVVAVAQSETVSKDYGDMTLPLSSLIGTPDA